MGTTTSQELLGRLMAADEYGPAAIWEFFPSPLHQSAVRDIDRSIKPGNGISAKDSGCYTLQNAYLELSDGSLRRPDSMVFCPKPTGISRKALTEVPEAVIEVVRPGSELKDLQLGPPNYLANGVKDVLVVNPETQQCVHLRRDGTQHLTRGTAMLLECGCEITL